MPGPPSAPVIDFLKARRVATPSGELVVFGPPPTDHVRPDLLDDAGLAASIALLSEKLRRAYRELAVAHLSGAAISATGLVSALFVLWLGPAAFAESLRSRAAATVWDVMLWWMVLAPAAVLIGGHSAVAIARRLREVRGWRHRTRELSARLSEARHELGRRSSA